MSLTLICMIFVGTQWHGNQSLYCSVDRNNIVIVYNCNIIDKCISSDYTNIVIMIIACMFNVICMYMYCISFHYQISK